MSTRERLPNRRAGTKISFQFRGAAYDLTFSRYEDGRLAEVFIDVIGHGLTPLSEDGKDAAVALSIALQYGAPAEVIRDAVTREKDGTPTGIIGFALDTIKGLEEEKK
jgi:hypothetical protein